MKSLHFCKLAGVKSCLSLLGICMLCLEPQSAQNVQEQDQPYNQYASPNPSVEELQKKSNQGTDKKKKKAEKDGLIRKFFQFVREYNAEIVAVSTVVMAIFTIALSASTYLLWKSGKKHSERELRAYVHIDEANIELKQNGIEAAISVKNAGQTPAYDFNVIATLDYYEIPRTKFEPYGTEGENSKGTVGPGIPVNIERCYPRALTTEQAQAIREHKFALFFYGRMEYRDAFENNRYTNFRFIGRFNARGKLFWDACEDGNDSN